ncbi:MAG: YaiI/YqxD family protein [Rhizobiales bacterium]|nr:YaiI/YqxD family protein [Hyphomicrobiales bacterium]
MSFRSPVAVRAAPIVLYVDGDACPVKNEVYRVAERHGVRVVLVSNAPLAVPRDVQVERVVVPSGPDVADDYIAERVSKGDVVVTADVPLAHRCVTAGADVLSPTGRAFTPSTIGDALATRDLMDSLRSAGEVTRGPPPFSARDRSAFLSALDLALVRLKRAGYVTASPESADDR